jgi:ubiquinone/menaquinone biosynthesis C-methylase UbiE
MVPASSPSFKDQTLKMVSRLASRGERMSASLRARIDPSATPAPDGSDGDDGRYGELWNPGNATDAIDQIYNTRDMESFEHGGQFDFETLSPYISKSTTVLDFGCGIGRLAKYVAPACKELWAVDVSAHMLKLAAQRLAEFDNVRLVQSKDTGIPDVPTASIDLVYSLLVLQHVEREDAFVLLEELRRVLRPDGRAVLNFPNLLNDGYLEGFVHYAHTGASSQANRARVYTPQEVERIVTAAGFDVEIEEKTEIWAFATPR